MGTSLTVLSKKLLEKEGYIVERTEHFNSYSMHREDLLGVADLIALNGKELLLIQTTSRGNISSRRNKCLASEKLKLWLSAGGKLKIHGWDKPKYRWRVKIEDIC